MENHKLLLAEFIDVMFVQFEPTTERQRNHIFNRPVIRISPPAVGEKISAFGFCCHKIEYWEGGPAVFGDGYTSTGNVTDVYQEKRDDSRLNFPCFETDARFDGGMSGGPVFDSMGRLCGIISDSLKPAEDNPDGRYISHVSTLWPMLSIPVSHDRAGLPPDEVPRVLDLARDGLILCEGWERVRFSYDGNGDLSKLELW